MPLFHGRSNGELRWEDVKRLIAESVQENELLDYKDYRVSVSRTVRKTIAAMANTYGGDIILGVGEAGYGKPKPLTELIGIPQSDFGKIKERVEGWNWEIRPPVLGLSVEQVNIPPSDHPKGSSEYCLVVVRIRQSDLVPHFIPGMGHYGRAGSQSQPHRDADGDRHLPTDQIRWLADRRAEHVRLRGDLLNWMECLEGGCAWHTVWCVPEFPTPGRPLLDASGVTPLKGIPTLNYLGSCLPLYQYGMSETTRWCKRTVQNGCYRQGKDRHTVTVNASGDKYEESAFLTYFVERRGLVAAKALTNLELSAEQCASNPIEALRFDWQTIVIHLLAVCRHASSLYEAAGYSGPVQFGVELRATTQRRPPAIYLGSGESPEPGYGFTNRSLKLDPASEMPMATRDRRVKEEHCCLATDLPKCVHAAAVASEWTSAFNWRFEARESEARVSAIEAAFLD